MLAEIFRFELRYQLRRPVLWIAAALFFVMTFLAVTTDAVGIGGYIGNLDRNAPFVILRLLLVMSLPGIVVTTALVASPALRDHESRTAEIVFSTPVRKREYLIGRFGGALVVALAVFLPVVLGVMLGSLMPWLDPERVGPFAIGPYLQGIAVFVVPNTIFVGSVCFALATMTRSLAATYPAIVGMIVAYGVAWNLLSDIENATLAAMLDPFGLGAFSIATRYWTVVERNTMLLPLDGVLVANRLVVVALAVLVLAITYVRFSFTVNERRRGGRWWPTPRPAAAGESGTHGEDADNGGARAKEDGGCGDDRGPAAPDAALLGPPPARAPDPPGSCGHRAQHRVPRHPGVRRAEHDRQLVR